MNWFILAVPTKTVFEYDLLDIFIFDILYFQSYFFLAPNIQVSYDKEESEALEEEKSIFNQATRI